MSRCNGNKPVSKVSTPSQPADFRTMSITPVLTCIMERTVVQRFLYHAFLSPPLSLSVTDQFACRPYGSIAFCCNNICPQHSIDYQTMQLLTNPCVISLDLGKIFGILPGWRNWPSLTFPDQVYNYSWPTFFTGHPQCTVFCDQMSTLKTIITSIMQALPLDQRRMW
jgi:hypothetical protein